MPVQQIAGLLGDVAQGAGNLVFGSGAFGDPVETFRSSVPPGLLNNFNEEQQRELGKQLQSNLRGAGSRGVIRESFREGVENTVAQRQRAEADQRARQSLIAAGFNPDAVQAAMDVAPEDRLDVLRKFQERGTTNQQEFRGIQRENPDARYTDYMRRIIGQNDPTSIQEYNFAQNDQGFAELQERERRADEAYTLSPGGQRRDGQGNVLAERGTARQLNAESGNAEETGSTTALQTRQGQIDWYMRENPELTPLEAADLVDGNIRSGQNPVTGRTSIVSIRTGEQIPVTNPNATPPGEPTGPSTSVREGTDASRTSGLGGAARRAVNTVFDIAGGGTPFGETDQARVNLNAFNQQFKLTLADVMSEGRRSNMLLEMLDSLAANPASIAQGSENMRNKLESGRAILDQQLREPLNVIENADQYRESRVQDMRLRRDKIQSLIDGVDVFLDNFGQGGQSEGPAPGVEPLDPEIEEILQRYEQ